jgi:hypothetical protein
MGGDRDGLGAVSLHPAARRGDRPYRPPLDPPLADNRFEQNNGKRLSAFECEPIDFFPISRGYWPIFLDMT